MNDTLEDSNILSKVAAVVSLGSKNYLSYKRVPYIKLLNLSPVLREIRPRPELDGLGGVPGDVRFGGEDGGGVGGVRVGEAVAGVAAQEAGADDDGAAAGAHQWEPSQSHGFDGSYDGSFDGIYDGRFDGKHRSNV